MDARCFSFMIIQLSVLSFSFSSSFPIFCHENERSALLEFKKSFFNKTLELCNFSLRERNIESWELEAVSGNCCAWDGIDCDMSNGHIIGVNIRDNCLSGTITANTTLFHLAYLQRLDLSLNHLTGQVPSNILKLTNLLSLDLSSNNGLELKKPNLLDMVQNLTKLEVLILTSVSISAPIPNILAKTSSLRSLVLSDCNLHGQFPPAIFKMPKLEFLDVSNNDKLSGHLPEFHWRSSLRSLWICSTNFSGKIPYSLGSLPFLKDLFLQNNSFTGQIPFSLGNLTQLTMLSLRDNPLGGVIPSWIGQLSNLELLDLTSNMLLGEVPSSLVNLTQLAYLSLENNTLSGQIFPHLVKLIHLYYVGLSLNNFGGPIPDSITELKNLSTLNLHSNNFSGTVRLSTFAKLKDLDTFTLSFNKLTLIDDLNHTNAKLRVLGLASCNLSSFPSFLQHQDELTWVDLSYNNISGQIPKWFLDRNIKSLIALNLSSNSITSSPNGQLNFRWKALETMELRDNRLEGLLPVPPASIKFYLVSGNKFSGELPSQLCDLNDIKGLDLNRNNLTGFLPHCLNKLSDTLSFLSLQGNKFYGEIPSLLPSGECKLRLLDFSSNRFQGSLPRSLANCYELEFLNFGGNWIEDIFPSWLGSLRNLKVLLLHSNRFHGSIGEPEFSNDFASLQVIDLSTNNFSNCLPSKYFECWKAMKLPSLYQHNYMEVGNRLNLGSIFRYDEMYDYSMTVVIKGVKMEYPKIQSYLTFIDLSSNNFTCEIPTSIESLVEVQFLNLSNNKLIGSIPLFLKALTNLQALDLSQNNLYGKIPEELAQLNFLGTFNVSYNNLSGRIPQGRHFDTFNNDSYFGNAELCGLPLSKKCDDDENLPQQQPKGEGEGEGEDSIEIDWKIVLIGYGSGLVVGAIIGQSFTIRPPSWILKYFRRRARHIR